MNPPQAASANMKQHRPSTNTTQPPARSAPKQKAQPAFQLAQPMGSANLQMPQPSSNITNWPTSSVNMQIAQLMPNPCNGLTNVNPNFPNHTAEQVVRQTDFVQSESGMGVRLAELTLLTAKAQLETSLAQSKYLSEQNTHLASQIRGLSQQNQNLIDNNACLATTNENLHASVRLLTGRMTRMLAEQAASKHSTPPAKAAPSNNLQVAQPQMQDASQSNTPRWQVLPPEVSKVNAALIRRLHGFLAKSMELGYEKTYASEEEGHRLVELVDDVIGTYVPEIIKGTEGPALHRMALCCEDLKKRLLFDVETGEYNGSLPDGMSDT